MSNSKEIVLAYEKALNNGNWKTAKQYLHTNLKVKGPLASFDNADLFIEAMKKRHSMIKTVDIKKIFA